VAAAARNEPVLATCSALRRSYREALREDLPGLVFVHLEAPRAILEERLRTRTGHFVPPALLGSQLATLEPLAPDEGEPGFAVNAAQEPTALAGQILARLRPSLARDQGSR
jgi:gluconokinase